MNRSYSKIRHIQEANIRLEKRILSEQNETISDEEKRMKANKCGHSTWGRYEKSGWKCNPIINCSQLDGKISDEIHGITKAMDYNVPKGDVSGTESYMGDLDKIKYDSHGNPIPVWTKTIYNEDPYSYVELFNGKFCIKNYKKENWVEVTDSKQIESVRKKLV